MRLVLPFVLRKKDGTISFTAINVTLATPHAPCSSRWDLTCLQAVKLLLITQDHTPNLAYETLPMLEFVKVQNFQTCLKCVSIVCIDVDGWGPSDGSQTCRKYCPLGHQKDDGKAQESRRDDGHQWTTDLVVSSFSWTTVTAVFW